MSGQWEGFGSGSVSERIRVRGGSRLGLDDAADALVDIARLLGVGVFAHYGLVVLLELDLPLLTWLGVSSGTVKLGVRCRAARQ